MPETRFSTLESIRMILAGQKFFVFFTNVILNHLSNLPHAVAFAYVYGSGNIMFLSCLSKR